MNMYVFKDTHRKKAPSNETPTLPKSISIDIWLVDTSNQLHEVFKLKQNVIKKK